MTFAYRQTQPQTADSVSVSSGVMATPLYEFDAFTGALDATPPAQRVNDLIVADTGKNANMGAKKERRRLGVLTLDCMTTILCARALTRLGKPTVI